MTHIPLWAADISIDHNRAGSERTMYRAIFDALPYGTAVVTANGRGRHEIVEANPALAAMFGRDMNADSILGREVEDLLVDADDDASPDADGWYEYHCWDPAGRVVWARWRFTPLSEHAGDPRSLVFVDPIDDRIRARHRASRQARLLDLTPEPVIIRALDGTILYWNRGAEDTYGYRAADAIGARTHDLLQTDFGGMSLATLEAHLDTAGAWQGMLSHRHADGRVLQVRSRQVRDSHGDGDPVILEMNIDITDQLSAERALATSEAKFRSQFAHSTVGQMIRRVDGTIEEANLALANMLGYDLKDLIGTNADRIFDAAVTDERNAALNSLARGDIDAINGETTLVCADGRRLDVELSVSVARDADGAVERITGIVQDITDRKAAQRMLAHQAFHDPLTGLANRALLVDRLGDSLARAQLVPTTVGLLYLDLDGFKTVNDSLGHHVGDQLLHEVGRRLDHCVRHDDVVARIGGDEFVVLCPDLDSRPRLAAIAQRVLTSVSEPYELRGAVIDSITASIGMSYPSPDSNADDALRNADRAMYEVKHSGKNSIRLAAVS